MTAKRAGRRRKGEPPPYLLHKGKGLAYVTFQGRSQYLGPFNSPESRRRYKEVVRSWERTTRPVKHKAESGCTVADLMAAHLDHAREHYRRDDGSNTSEYKAFIHTLRPLAEIYGDRPADEFRPRDLKELRERWIGEGLCRKTVNTYTGRVRRLFEWGAEEEIVTEETAGALAFVRDLAANRTPAVDHPPVEPVPMRDMVRALGALHPMTATMVRVQYYCGARPGEICRMKAEEIERTGTVRMKHRRFKLPGGVWVFQPGQHKTRHKGKVVAYLIGPRAQTLLAPVLAERPTGFLFPPTIPQQAYYASKRPPGTLPKRRSRRKPNPIRTAGEHYTSVSYADAVRNACVRAGVSEWTPGRLRHNFLTKIDAAEGIQLASAAVSHGSVKTTEIYVEANLHAVAKVMMRMG